MESGCPAHGHTHTLPDFINYKQAGRPANLPGRVRVVKADIHSTVGQVLVDPNLVEFKEKIETVGAMDDERLEPLRAYFYGMDEKFMVYDYMTMGNLYAHLHGKIYLLH